MDKNKIEEVKRSTSRNSTRRKRQPKINTAKRIILNSNRKLNYFTSLNNVSYHKACNMLANDIALDADSMHTFDNNDENSSDINSISLQADSSDSTVKSLIDNSNIITIETPKSFLKHFFRTEECHLSSHSEVDVTTYAMSQHASFPQATKANENWYAEFIDESTDSQLLGIEEHPDFEQQSTCDIPQKLTRWNRQDKEASYDQSEFASLHLPNNSSITSDFDNRKPRTINNSECNMCDKVVTYIQKTVIKVMNQINLHQ